MKHSGLLRTFLLSIFALVLAGGIMTAQAQETIIVDADDPNADAQDIPTGLSLIDEDGDLLVIRASNYNEDINTGNTALSPGDSFTIEVRGDDDSGAQETSITEFQVAGGVNVTVQSDGNAFFALADDTGDDLILTDGSLTLNASDDLQLAGGVDVLRTANASLSGSSPAFPSNVDVAYDVTDGSFDAGLEAPADLGNGILTITDGGSGSGNTVTFPNPRFASFAAQALTLNGTDDVAADFEGDASFTNSIAVDAAQGLAVAGELTIEGTDNSLDVDAGGSDQVQLGSLTFASVQSSNQGAGTALLRGDGNLTVDGAVTFQAEANGGGDDTWIQEVRAEAGSSNFDIGSVVETSVDDGGATDQAVVDVINTQGGTVALAGGTIRHIDQSAGTGSTLRINGDVEVDVASPAGGIANSGPQASIEVTGGNTLTLRNVASGSNSVTHQNSDTGSITGSGTVLFESGDSDDQTISVTDNDAGAEDINRLPNVEVSGGNGLTINGAHSSSDEAGIQIGGSLVGDASVNLATSSGGATVGGSVTVNGGNTDITGVAATTTTTDVELNGGTLTIDGSRLEVVRDFVRTSTNASLSSTGTSELAFTQSGSDGTFDTESIFTLNGTLEINKTNASLTLVEALRVSGDVEIVDQGQFLQTTFALEDNLFLTQNGAAPLGGQFTVDSDLETGENFVVFESAYTVAGDDTLGAAIVNGGSDVAVQPSNSPETNATTLKFDDSIELRDGGLTIASGEDLSPAEGTDAEIVRTLAAANPTDIDASASGASFNGDNTLYDLTYTGGEGTAANELTDFVRDLTVDAGANPHVDGTVQSEYTVNGVLTVDGRIDDFSGDWTLELAADSVEHSVTGQVGDELSDDPTTNEAPPVGAKSHGSSTGVTTLRITGQGVTVNGSDDSGTVSALEDLLVEGAGTVVSDIQRITGDLTLEEDGSLTLGLSDPDSGDQTVAGLVTVSDSLALASDVELTSTTGTDDVKVNNTGRINFASSDLVITGQDNDFDGDADAAYYSDGGNLVFDGGGTTPTFGTAGEAVPRVVVEQSIELTEDVATSEFLDVNANIALGSNDWDFMGDVELAANVTQSGIFRATGATTITAEGNQSISNFTVAAGDTVDVQTNDPANLRTLTITGTFAMENGALSYGANDFRLTGGSGAFTYEGGEFIAATGRDADGPADEETGYIEFDNSSLETSLDTTVTIPNLFVNDEAALGGDDENLRVANNLVLSEVFDASGDDGTILIGDGAWITRDGYTAPDVLAEELEFEGMYNVEYRGSGSFTSSYELDNSDDTINNLTVDVGGTVTFDDGNVSGDVVVNGTIHVADGFIAYPNRQLTLADGATFQQSTNEGITDNDSTPALVADSTYTLMYTGSSDIDVTEKEFLDGGVVNLVSMMSGSGVDVHLDSDGFARTVLTLLVNNSDGDFDLQGQTLTVEDTTVVRSGILDDEGDNNNNRGALVATDDFHVEGGTVNATVRASEDVLFTGGTFGGGSALVFEGQGEQQLQLAQDDNVSQLVLSQMANGVFPRVTLSGGNLDIGSLIFDNGLLDTGDNRVSVTSFNRDQVASDEASHIVGTMRQFVSQGFTGRIEYPVGTDTSEALDVPQYRPYALTFDQSDPAITSTNVDVTHVDESPMGNVGLPLDGGEGVSVGNYPDYYWLVDATTSLGSSQTFDVELTGTEPFGLSFEDEEDLRIIRRFDGNAETNQWRLQGDGSNYDNILSIDNGDSTAVVRNIGSTGGIVEQGARFTIGLPSRAPMFTTVPEDTLTVQEDSTLTFQFVAEGRDVDSELAFSLEDAPEGASISVDSTSGTQAFATFSWTPSFDQQGDYAITAVVTDESNDLTDTETFNVTVEDNEPPITLGDPSDDGEVTSADASLVLQFVVGLSDFSLAQQNAADVSGDGNVNAADASLIQQFVVGLIDEFPAANGGSEAAVASKSGGSTMSTVSGRLGWGELQSGSNGQMTLPIVLGGNAENVRSVQLTAEFNTDAISIQDVQANLPNGWMIAHNIDSESGKLHLALAGAEPVSAGTLADIILNVRDENTTTNLAGTGMLNTASTHQLGSADVKSLPNSFALETNYPNPFQSSTTIAYELPEETDVTLEVYNVLGQRVTTLVNEKKNAGRHEVSFDASNLASGMYIYRIKAGSFTESSRMTVVR